MTRTFLMAGLAAGSWFLLAQSANAQNGGPPCFETLPAHAALAPRAPMLVDKCSGRTWLLTKSGRGYRWTLIERENEPPKRGDVAAAERESGKRDGTKCFTFNGRKFCE